MRLAKNVHRAGHADPRWYGPLRHRARGSRRRQRRTRFSTSRAPPPADAITGVNKYTFRSGRQTYQDVATAGTFIGDPSGKKVLVFAQDTAFGQGNLAGVTAVLGGQGRDVSSVLVPEDATEFTRSPSRSWMPPRPGVRRVGRCDLRCHVGGTHPAGCLRSTLPSSPAWVMSRPTAPTVPRASNISFLNHYFGGATDNAVNTAMIERAQDRRQDTPDLFSPDGFNAAIMLVQAIQPAGGDNVDDMIASLEGYTFDGPKGSDHDPRRGPRGAAADVPGEAGRRRVTRSFPELVKVVDADTVAPPQKTTRSTRAEVPTGPCSLSSTSPSPSVVLASSTA